ncbi:MAG: hypothetical protein J6U86_05545 [Clostridia bacterium]|nr:hypothetical protein [Clostridia bacterium]
MREDNQRPEVSEIDPVPLYRSYGVRKKEGFFTHLNLWLARIIAIMIFSIIGVAGIVAFYATIRMLGAIGIVITFILIFCFIYFKVLRTARKRYKFIKKLKKFCKKNNLTLKIHRGFFKGLRRNKTGFDFTVTTPSVIWCARFFTCRKRNSHVTFEDNSSITITENIIKNRIFENFGLVKTKNSRVPYSFNDPLPQSDIKAERALIFNPVPRMVFKKNYDGVTEATGSGEQLHGYTIFTGSGFLNTLKR